MKVKAQNNKQYAVNKHTWATRHVLTQTMVKCKDEQVYTDDTY